jgi:hypothetical protein
MQSRTETFRNEKQLSKNEKDKFHINPAEHAPTNISIKKRKTREHEVIIFIAFNSILELAERSYKYLRSNSSP